MSSEAEQHTDPQDLIDERDRRIAELEERVAELEAVEERVKTLERRVNERNENRFKTLAHVVFGDPEDKQTFLYDDQEEFIAEHGGLLPQLRAIGGIQSVVESLGDRVDHKSQQIAKVRRRLSILSEETGVDVSDSKVAGDDKIQRVIKFGPRDVRDGRIYAVHYRAETLLKHAGTVGTKTQDKFGTRIVIGAPDAREKLEDVRDEDLTSLEVRRVFEKLEEWGEDSPRRVSAETGGDGVNRLVIYLNQDFSEEES